MSYKDELDTPRHMLVEKQITKAWMFGYRKGMEPPNERISWYALNRMGYVYDRTLASSLQIGAALESGYKAGADAWQKIVADYAAFLTLFKKGKIK